MTAPTKGTPGARKSAVRGAGSAAAKAIGERIAKFRLGQGLTQREVERAAGLAETTISRLEYGRAGYPTDETLDLVADALGLTRADLLGTGAVDPPEGALPKAQRVARGRGPGSAHATCRRGHARSPENSRTVTLSDGRTQTVCVVCATLRAKGTLPPLPKG